MCYSFLDWMSQQEKSTKMARDILRLTMVSLAYTFSITYINIFYLSARLLILDSHQYINTYFSQEPFSQLICLFVIPPQTLFVVGILFSPCPSVRPSVTFCFFNILKSHRWIFIKPCKHVYICKTNTLNKKVRTRGQFY